jgi:hypothetical protein
MSRAQQGQIESTATANSATDTAAADKSEAATQADIGNQQSQLAKFAANNPYVQGGALETATNKSLAGTADATAAAAAAKGQTMAQRTGQNPAAAVAAGEAEQQAAQRTLGTQEAGATESRLAAGAKYGQDVLGAGSTITQEQQNLASQQSGQAQGQLNTGEQAAQTPSFLDELGQGLIQGGTAVAGGLAKGCWVAAELYGGWNDPRVSLVRSWLFGGPMRNSLFSWAYARYGFSWAGMIRRNRLLRGVFRVIFDRFLVAAGKWQVGG